jgi:anti-sigma regulatory factor (Ser/Thr protein kinase)
MSSGASPGPAELAFPGDGEMAQRMRAYPWETSPLGDPRDWPASLRTACRICLTSRFPIIIWWGEELRFFYNDAYLPLLGNKHPATVRPGRQVWSEIWDTIGPMLDSVMRSGQATWSEDLLLPMNRHGHQVQERGGGRSLPLAIRSDARRTEAAYVLPPRSTLLLYTDGLVERRGRSITDGMTAAGEVLRAGSGATLEDLAAQVMTRMAPAGGYEDDVALVLYHQPGPLEIVFAAESGQLAPVRATLRGWLRSCDISAKMVQDVLVAAGEACANAIEHGHRHSPGTHIRLRAVSSAHQLRLTITDAGRWKPAPPGDRGPRGHGIALMRALMQQVTIEPGPAGTTVDMYARIT